MESVQIRLATCNGARYVPEQLASLQRQTYQDFTLLVSDDGSTDETPALLQEFAGRDGLPLRRMRPPLATPGTTFFG